MDAHANANLITPEDLQAPFLGFVVGSLCVLRPFTVIAYLPFHYWISSLVGVTILQAYQYFLNYVNDSKWRKLTVSGPILIYF